MVEGNRSDKIEQRVNAAPSHHRWPVRLAILAGAVLISAPVAVFGGIAPATAASQVLNGSAKAVSGTNSLNGVACGSATFCVAVGADSGEGVVVPISGGTPGSAELVSGTVLLSAVTCPTATICIAVGNGQYSEYGNTWWDGVVVEITNGVPGQAVVAPLGEGMPDAPDEMYLNGVGCSSASACVAVGYDDYEHGVVVPIRDGSPGMEKEVPGGDNGAYDLNGVACYKKACLAVGPSMEETRYPDATVVPITNGKPVSSNLASKTRDLAAVSCRSADLCVSVGSGSKGALIVVIKSVNPQSPKAAPESNVLNGVSCPTTTVDCLSVGDNTSGEGEALEITNGSPGRAVVVTGSQDLNGVTCPSNTSCLVVGHNGSDQGVVAKIKLPLP